MFLEGRQSDVDEFGKIGLVCLGAAFIGSLLGAAPSSLFVSVCFVHGSLGGRENVGESLRPTLHTIVATPDLSIRTLNTIVATPDLSIRTLKLSTIGLA